MAEPDFDQIAKQLIHHVVEAAFTARMSGTFNVAIFSLALEVIATEQLRLIWNARGAADQVVIDGLNARIAELELNISLRDGEAQEALD
jgi:hypothetical protein